MIDVMQEDFIAALQIVWIFILVQIECEYLRFIPVLHIIRHVVIGAVLTISKDTKGNCVLETGG